jgi:hypothetical protein
MKQNIIILIVISIIIFIQILVIYFKMVQPCTNEGNKYNYLNFYCEKSDPTTPPAPPGDPTTPPAPPGDPTTTPAQTSEPSIIPTRHPDAISWCEINSELSEDGNYILEPNYIGCIGDLVFEFHKNDSIVTENSNGTFTIRQIPLAFRMRNDSFEEDPTVNSTPMFYNNTRAIQHPNKTDYVIVDFSSFSGLSENNLKYKFNKFEDVEILSIQETLNISRYLDMNYTGSNIEHTNPIKLYLKYNLENNIPVSVLEPITAESEQEESEQEESEQEESWCEINSDRFEDGNYILEQGYIGCSGDLVFEFHKDDSIITDHGDGLFTIGQLPLSYKMNGVVYFSEVDGTESYNSEIIVLSPIFYAPRRIGIQHPYKTDHVIMNNVSIWLLEGNYLKSQFSKFREVEILSIEDVLENDWYSGETVHHSHPIKIYLSSKLERDIPEYVLDPIPISTIVPSITPTVESEREESWCEINSDLFEDGNYILEPDYIGCKGDLVFEFHKDDSIGGSRIIDHEDGSFTIGQLPLVFKMIDLYETESRVLTPIFNGPQRIGKQHPYKPNHVIIDYGSMWWLSGNNFNKFKEVEILNIQYASTLYGYTGNTLHTHPIKLYLKSNLEIDEPEYVLDPVT